MAWLIETLLLAIGASLIINLLICYMNKLECPDEPYPFIPMFILGFIIVIGFRKFVG